MSSTPHSVKDHQIDKVMESRSQSSQILMNGIIEEKCKSKVDVGDGYWRWSWNFSFIMLVRCAVQILSAEIQFLINEEKSKKGASGTPRGLCTSKMLTAILKCVGMGISLLIGVANEDQSDWWYCANFSFKVGITLKSRRRYYVYSSILVGIP